QSSDLETFYIVREKSSYEKLLIVDSSNFISNSSNFEKHSNSNSNYAGIECRMVRGEVQITAIKSDFAKQIGFMVGDRIISFNNAKVKSPEHFSQSLQDLQIGTSARIVVKDLMDNTTVLKAAQTLTVYPE